MAASKSRNTAGILSVAICAWLFQGCSLHTANLNPQPAVAGPARYSIDASSVEGAEAWWRAFGNRELNGFIDEGFRRNLAIDRAAARVRQARAERRRVAAAPLPVIDLEAGAETREPLRGRNSRETGGSLVLAWEVDLWKRLDSATRAADYETRARAADYHAIRLLISGEVASAFFDAVEQQMLLDLLAAQLETNRTLLELTELRFDQAGASAVDVFQQRRQLESTREQVVVARGALRVAENRLDIVLGAAADGVDRVRRFVFPAIGPPPETGIPADLLIRRPDLVSLQSQLIADDYRVAQAIAERLPRVGIGAVIGYSDDTISGDAIHSAAVRAVQPLIDWGERKAEVDRRRAIFEEELSRYTEAYLVAIEEVENAVYLERRQQERITSLRRQRDLSALALSEATNRYSNGLTDYLPVLEAVQSLQRTEREIIIQERNLVENRVSLNLALGGPLSTT